MSNNFSSRRYHFCSDHLLKPMVWYACISYGWKAITFDHLRSILSSHGGHVRSRKLFLQNGLHFWNQHHWKPVIWYTYQYIFKVFILDLLRSSEVMEVMIRSWWGQTTFFHNLTSFLAWSSFKTYGLIYISIWIMSYKS